MELLFTKSEPEYISENLIKLIGTDWMLICAGSISTYNMMTASWGNMGVLWNKPMVTVFVRPQLYTYNFIENNDYFTLNFFPNTFKKELNILGTKSGRDIDKMDRETLDAIQTPLKNVAFQQASLVLECKKMYYDDIKPSNFIDPEIDILYSEKDYHRMYFAEIISVWEKK